MEQPKKVALTPRERAFIIMKIAHRAKKDPEFKARVDKMIEERKTALSDSNYLNEAHRENSEAAMKYIGESKKRSIDWEKESERQNKNSK